MSPGSWADQRGFVPLVGALFAAFTTCGHFGEAQLIQLTNEALGAVADQVATDDPVVPLTQRLVPDPPYGPEYDTSGTYPQFSGVDGLDAVNAALRKLIVDDQARPGRCSRRTDRPHPSRVRARTRRIPRRATSPPAPPS
jgi:hypothetical protein